MKKTKSNKASSQELQNGHSPSSKFLKLLDPEASWDKDNLGDTLHWIRQGLGLSCGLLCSAVPLIGAFWIVAFHGLSYTVYYTFKDGHHRVNSSLKSRCNPWSLMRIRLVLNGLESVGFFFYLELYGQRNAPPLKVCRVQLCSSTQMILSSNKVQEYFTDGS